MRLEEFDQGHVSFTILLSPLRVWQNYIYTENIILFIFQWLSERFLKLAQHVPSTVCTIRSKAYSIYQFYLFTEILLIQLCCHVHCLNQEMQLRTFCKLVFIFLFYQVVYFYTGLMVVISSTHNNKIALVSLKDSVSLSFGVWCLTLTNYLLFVPMWNLGHYRLHLVKNSPVS